VVTLFCSVKSTTVLLVSLAILSLLFPAQMHAQGNTGSLLSGFAAGVAVGSLVGGSNPFAGSNAATANPQCNPWYPQCPCNTVPAGGGKCKAGKNRQVGT